jgi:hypothetical protein
MKRQPKVHMMKEFDRNRSRCGAHVNQVMLTDKWQHITCTVCLPPGQRARVGAYIEAHG